VTTLITGVTGQDGSYLAELVLAGDKPIIGAIDPHSAIPDYVAKLQRTSKLSLIACDIGDTSAFRHLLRELHPNRVFHLAAISTARETADDSERSQRVNVASVEALIDWAKRDAPGARVLTMSSAAIFGESPGAQNEASPPAPLDEYGRQKLRVRELADEARNAGLYFACAIPFNHESPRRDERFVFAKVCQGAARVARGELQSLTLGNLEARRDWGYAPEYCAALKGMLETPLPHELVLATGESHSVRELVAAAFIQAGMPEWEEHVTSDFMLQRAADYDLVGDPSRAQQVLGWTARTKFAQLVELMMQHALSE
jgi:GDPmannose 4,6-dehydratase